jgi:chemotaxis protein methyltransferase CheR
MLRGTGTQEGKMKAGPELLQAVQFERLNLLEEAAYPRTGTFDLVFCRNVLIYFQPETKAQVVHRLFQRLKTDGYLFLGHSESLNHLIPNVRSAIPTVYTRPGALQKD